MASLPAEPNPFRGGSLLGRLRGVADAGAEVAADSGGTSEEIKDEKQESSIEAPQSNDANEELAIDCQQPEVDLLEVSTPGNMEPDSPPQSPEMEADGSETRSTTENEEPGTIESLDGAASESAPQITEESETAFPDDEFEDIEILATPTAPAGQVAAEEPPIAVEQHLLEAPELAQLAPVQLCPVCSWTRRGDETFCLDCGYCFPATVAAAPAATAAPNSVNAVANVDERNSAVRLKERYELVEKVREHNGVARFRGLDHGTGRAPALVWIVRGSGGDGAVPEAVPVAEAVPAALAAESGDDEFVPVFDFPMPGEAVPEAMPVGPEWPGPDWEAALLATANHPGLPAVLDSFVEDGVPYLVEEVPAGRPLWDAWDDPDSTAQVRFAWLKQVAQALHALHGAGCIFEGIRPEVIVIDDSGQARLNDLADLLPLPVPADAPLRGSPYTAPELMNAPHRADARADLYSFGGLLYALNEGRELNELDFERGVPKSFILRYPESHPLLARLITKTFNSDLGWRFPSDESAREDATGFVELIRVLDTCRRVLDHVRLDIACWTTTGIVRTGNEDGFALIHSVEARQDDQGESALIVLADGMGGYEGGEVAAAMAVQCIRRFLLQQKPFAHLAGGTPFHPDRFGPDSTIQAPVDIESMKQLLGAALKEANKQIYNVSRTPGGKRGMGCTAEVVLVNGRNVIVGHVGDSRTYHYHDGRLIQLTRDQTLVNRLVELGRLTPEEAEKHDQRNQLSQAVGGQPDVSPGLYSGVMKPGDWVIVCSDGLTNHTSNDYLADMLRTESAEIAARRLVNSVLLEGATDNATVVLVRAT
jgi:protein phosphatase